MRTILVATLVSLAFVTVCMEIAPTAAAGETCVPGTTLCCPTPPQCKPGQMCPDYVPAYTQCVAQTN